MLKNKFLRPLISAVFWLAVWELCTFLISDSLKMFLPSPFSVFKALWFLLPSSEFLIACGATLLRILSGFIIGSIIGILFAVLTSELKIFDVLLSPMLKVIRAVPVVSFIILAFLFIGVDYLPIFISALMVIPLVWQSVNDALCNTDNKLLEMCKVYRLSPLKSLLFVKLPTNLNAIISALINGVGLAWKSGVAAEVLCTPLVSIGKNIQRAKGNLEFDKVYAVTLCVVILSLIFEFLLKYFWRKINKKKGETL